MRNKDSHKGENGKVLVVGGSEKFYGSAILASLAVEYSGVDLIFPFIPACHIEAAKTYSLNFILNSFSENNLTNSDIKKIIKLSKEVDVVLIGPGLSKDKDVQKNIIKIIENIETKLVIDADAIIFTNNLTKDSIFTPHKEEFFNLTKDEASPENIQKWAENLSATIICKGVQDIIADKNELIINESGNALMTVGGTGDLLAGLIAGLSAQGYNNIDACKIASDTIGEAAENLAKKQNSIRAVELLKEIPKILKKNN